ncbi:MAG TPA: DUF3467 domain-containing protein [Brevefilum sp.]|nr:DUF3467 domain-containing protein [Brevefilum sp.]HOR19289.1 DUF3467 domain-containing protein [Brevefilum sp.]HPL69894.1 DUF3467 domain-containing protein [Brevefilum sp.]
MTQKPIPNLEIPQDLESKYVNFVRIAHTVSEFVLDFSLLLPGVTKFEVNSRLMMSPTAAKLFLQALTENLKRYETNFGKITIPGSHSLADDLFRPIDPPEGG